MRKDKPVYEDDDGEVIAPMDLEGMPWSRRKSPDFLTRRGRDAGMTDAEIRTYRWAAVKAGLLIALIYGGAAAGLIGLLLLLWR